MSGAIAMFIPSQLSDLADYGRVVTVGPPGSGAHFDDPQEGVNSITDSAADNPYSLVLLPGIKNIGTSDGLGTLDMRGTSGAERDYIALRGFDRFTSILQRTLALTNLNAVVQACKHQSISNLTFDSELARHVHWDTGQADSYINVDGVTLKSNGNPGLSMGGSGGAKVRVTNCFFDHAFFAIHGQSTVSASILEIDLASLQFNHSGGAVMNFDLASSLHPTTIVVTGIKTTPGVGDTAYVAFVPPADESKVVQFHADVPPGYFLDDNTNLRFASLILPQNRRFQLATAAAVCEIVTYDAAADRLTTTTSADAPFPAVIAQPGGSINNFPNLQQGPVGTVKILTAGAVALGDPIVTSTSAGFGMANPAQSDPTKILGWAITAKTAGVAGRVNVRLNKVVGF